MKIVENIKIRYLKLKKDLVRVLLWTNQFLETLPENPKTLPPSRKFQRYGRSWKNAEIEQMCDTRWKNKEEKKIKKFIKKLLTSNSN